jgi:hypothetical protein
VEPVAAPEPGAARVWLVRSEPAARRERAAWERTEVLVRAPARVAARNCRDRRDGRWGRSRWDAGRRDQR